MFLYFLQNQISPFTFSKKNPTPYVPRAENDNGKNMPKYKHLKCLRFFTHIFFSAASTVLSKVFEFLHKAGRSHRKLDCIPPNILRGSHLSAGPWVHVIKSLTTARFWLGPAPAEKIPACLRCLPKGSTGEATLLHGCKRAQLFGHEPCNADWPQAKRTLTSPFYLFVQTLQ